MELRGKQQDSHVWVVEATVTTLRNTVWLNWLALFYNAMIAFFTPVTMEHDYGSPLVIQLSQKVSIFVRRYFL